jgi:hypothetical protein
VDTVKEIKPNQLVYAKEGEGNYSHRTIRSCQRKNIEIARLLLNPGRTLYCRYLLTDRVPPADRANMNGDARGPRHTPIGTDMRVER